ncbi:hypothetical protein [Desulfovibrio psychrotolerans]|uniref:hypothetical protein n=1 Tax=Desulfovibrio psychrotolerans TaxID=415242 RepID=UPI00157B84FD|nr:hypothetical protein [Desulfovibrio psychrotolerans]
MPKLHGETRDTASTVAETTGLPAAGTIRPHVRTVLHLLLEWAQAERTPGTDGLRYAQTSLGGDDPDTLRAVLCPDHPDHETFVELLLFPDTVLHAKLDTVLTPASSQEDCQGDSRGDFRDDSQAVSRRDSQGGSPSASQHASGTPGDSCGPLLPHEARYLTTVLESHPRTGTLLLDNGSKVPFGIPGNLWKTIVPRLRLCAVIPHEVLNTIHRVLPPPVARHARIRLRAARYGCPALLLRFLERYPASDPAYTEVLDFWLHILSTLPQDADPQAVLLRRYRRLEKALRQTREFAERLQRYSMEMLMMQGAQAPFIHEEHARATMRIMERIGLAMFDTSLAGEGGMREADFGTLPLPASMAGPQTGKRPGPWPGDDSGGRLHGLPHGLPDDLSAGLTDDLPSGQPDDRSGPHAGRQHSEDIMDAVLRTMRLLDR